MERISSRSVPDFLFFFAFSGVTICTGFYRCFLIGAVFSLSNSCSKMCVRKLRSARKTNTNAFLAFPALVWNGSGVDTFRIDFRPNSYNKCGNYRWFRIGHFLLVSCSPTCLSRTHSIYRYLVFPALPGCMEPISS